MLEVLQEDDEFELAGSARVDVLVSAIKPLQASQVAKDLSALLPLEQAKLTHLKRIRSSQQPGGGRVLEAVLGPSDMYHSIGHAKREEIEKRYSLVPTVYAVPRLEPRTRAQFEKGQSTWPMIFHHSTSEEARRAARVVPERDILDAVRFMRAALSDAERGRRQRGGKAMVGAVLVDPVGGTVVASASTERQSVFDEGHSSFRHHPLHHASMLCVQGAGRALVAGKIQASTLKFASTEKPPSGADEGEAGETPRTSEADMGEGSPSDRSGDPCVGVDELPPEQYLCTGFDLYITQEPCLMCGMALIHSRVRRVIYGIRSPAWGCLGSLMLLHTLPQLNHNYRVFEGVCEDECRESVSLVGSVSELKAEVVH